MSQANDLPIEAYAEIMQQLITSFKLPREARLERAQQDLQHLQSEGFVTDLEVEQLSALLETFGNGYSADPKIAEQVLGNISQQLKDQNAGSVAVTITSIAAIAANSPQDKAERIKDDLLFDIGHVSDPPTIAEGAVIGGIVGATGGLVVGLMGAGPGAVVAGAAAGAVAGAAAAAFGQWLLSE